MRRDNDPNHYLIAYGTLRPGESNYHIVESIKGEWLGGTITGVIEQFGPYPRFRSGTETDTPIEVAILYSTELDRHWQRIDEFEGPGYIRILHPATIEKDTIIGYLYAHPDMAN